MPRTSASIRWPYLTAVIPSSEVAIAVSMVVFPSFSMLQDQPGRLRESFEKVLQVAAMVCMPIGFGILAVAPEFVRIVLGERWLGIAPVMQALSIMGIAKALEGTMNSLMMAVGRPGIVTGLRRCSWRSWPQACTLRVSGWGILRGCRSRDGNGPRCCFRRTPAACPGHADSWPVRVAALMAAPLVASSAMAAGIILLKRLMGTVGLPGFVLLVAAGVGLYAACLAVADAALTSGRYRGLAADLLAGLRASGKNGVTPLSERAGGSAAALRADDPLR